MIVRKGLSAFVFTGLLLAVAGCAGVGPHTISRDRFDYTTAISDSWKAQMLVNMVKMRYGDTPTFLDVASVINQYSIESQVDLRLSWADPVTAAMTDTQSVGGAARYIDRPTITYSPLMGEKFARSLMTPIPPAAILSLIQANYPVDLVLRLCVHSVNGIRNSRAKEADAFVAVPYHGYWFWIDDRDLPSKRMFSFIMFIFTLVETGGKEGAPIVTIPAG